MNSLGVIPLSGRPGYNTSGVLCATFWKLWICIVHRLLCVARSYMTQTLCEQIFQRALKISLDKSLLIHEHQKLLFSDQDQEQSIVSLHNIQHHSPSLWPVWGSWWRGRRGHLLSYWRVAGEWGRRGECAAPATGHRSGEYRRWEREKGCLWLFQRYQFKSVFTCVVVRVSRNKPSSGSNKRSTQSVRLHRRGVLDYHFTMLCGRLISQTLLLHD